MFKAWHQMTMTDDDILNEFRAAEALLEGHFILSSGLRSPRYLQCARVLMNPARAAGVIAAAAGPGVEQFAGDIGEVDAAGVFVLELDEAAASAPVAERFPLAPGQFAQWLAPERLFGGAAALASHLRHSGAEPEGTNCA